MADDPEWTPAAPTELSVGKTVWHRAKPNLVRPTPFQGANIHPDTSALLFRCTCTITTARLCTLTKHSESPCKAPTIHALALSIALTTSSTAIVWPLPTPNNRATPPTPWCAILGFSSTSRGELQAARAQRFTASVSPPWPGSANHAACGRTRRGSPTARLTFFQSQRTRSAQLALHHLTRPGANDH
ncbi:hypothetical protein Emed_005710 [Eimeria media]